MENVSAGPENTMSAATWQNLLQTWGHEEITGDDGSEHRYIELPATANALAQEYSMNWDTFKLEPTITDYVEP